MRASRVVGSVGGALERVEASHRAMSPARASAKLCGPSEMVGGGVANVTRVPWDVARVPWADEADECVSRFPPVPVRAGVMRVRACEG